MNGEPKSAQVCLNESVKLWPEARKGMTEEEVADCEKVNNATSRKVEMERKNLTTIGNINDYAFLKGSAPKVETAADPAQKPVVKAEINPKYDWYQNQSHVFITFKVVGDKELAKKTKVSYAKDSVTLEAPDQSIVVPLAHEINVEGCMSFPFTQKLEVKLEKVE